MRGLKGGFRGHGLQLLDWAGAQTVDFKSAFATEFVSILCPYCWESYESQVDLSAGSFTYVEDCQVCCQPIELSCAVEEGLLVAVQPERMD